MPTKTYSTREVAKLTGLSLVTVQRWIRQGKVEAPKLVKRDSVLVRLWSGTDVLRLLEAKQAVYRRGRGRKKK